MFTRSVWVRKWRLHMAYIILHPFHFISSEATSKGKVCTRMIKNGSFIVINYFQRLLRILAILSCWVNMHRTMHLNIYNRWKTTVWVPKWPIKPDANFINTATVCTNIVNFSFQLSIYWHNFFLKCFAHSLSCV